jgi:hypothetical protein
MRRKDREVSDPVIMEAIIAQAEFCRMAMCDNGKPYLVPLCFGYANKTVYVHSAASGRKIDILREGSEVWLEFTAGQEIVEHDVACKWRLRYKCVMASGRSIFVTSIEEKRSALGIIMAHYAQGVYGFPDPDIDATTVFKIPLNEMTCKISA